MSEGLWKILAHDSRIRAVFLLAITLNLLILGYLAIYPRGIFAKGDSKDYQVMAINLLQYRTLTRGIASPDDLSRQASPGSVADKGNETRVIPDPYRTPIYPAFLALVYAAGGGPFLALGVQSIFNLLLVGLTILLAARLFQPQVGWLAGLLAALEPLSLIYSHELMSDILFTLMIVGAVYIFMRLLTAEGPGKISSIRAALGGLLLGLAILTRPIGVYFPAVLVLLWVIGALVRRRQSLGGAGLPRRIPPVAFRVAGKDGSGLKYLAIFVGVMALTVSPWIIRNYVTFNRVFISTSADHNLLITIASQIVAQVRSPEEQVSSWQLRRDLEQELVAQMAREGLDITSEPARAAYFRQWSCGIIKSYPGLFLKDYLWGAGTLFFTDVTGFYELLGFTREAGGWLMLSRRGLRPALTKYFGEQWPLWVGGALPLILYDAGVYVLALGGGVALWRSRNLYLLLLMTSIIGYWVAVSAIGVMPRYRLPLMPFLICLAAWGWFNLITRKESGAA